METSVNNKCRAFTSLEQSKKLAEILPLESADMYYECTKEEQEYKVYIGRNIAIIYNLFSYRNGNTIPCWSLAALLHYLNEIKPRVYTPVLFPSEGRWILQFAEYGHGNVCEVSCDNPNDACYEMIIKLNELKKLGL